MTISVARRESAKRIPTARPAYGGQIPEGVGFAAALPRCHARARCLASARHLLLRGRSPRCPTSVGHLKSAAFAPRRAAGNNRRVKIFAACALVLASLALVGAGCGGDDEDTAEPTPTATETVTETETTRHHHRRERPRATPRTASRSSPRPVAAAAIRSPQPGRAGASGRTSTMLRRPTTRSSSGSRRVRARCRRSRTISPRRRSTTWRRSSRARSTSSVRQAGIRGSGSAAVPACGGADP